MENNTLLKIMSFYWQLFIIPNGIEDSLLPVGLASDIALKKKEDWITKNEDTSKTHEMPFDTCFGKSSDSEPIWIPIFPSEVGGMLSLAAVSKCVLHNLLPKAPPETLKVFIENMHTFSPTQQYKTVQSLLKITQWMQSHTSPTSHPHPKTSRGAALSPSPAFPALYPPPLSPLRKVRHW